MFTQLWRHKVIDDDDVSRFLEVHAPSIIQDEAIPEEIIQIGLLINEYWFLSKVPILKIVT